MNVNIEDNPEKSPALERLRPYWAKDQQAWANNWAARLPFSEYVPCSALAATYYEHMVRRWAREFGLMKVNVYGNRPYLDNLQKLGPVLHFIGDAVVPQHVRAAHGFCHTEWEASVQTLQAAGFIRLDENLVREFLASEPFNKDHYWSGGPLDGLYPIDWMIVRIADMTREKVQVDGNRDIDALWNADDGFWSGFWITQVALAFIPPNALPHNCMQYLYNLGVAGCVNTLIHASEDLRRANIGNAPQNVGDSVLLPDIKTQLRGVVAGGGAEQPVVGTLAFATLRPQVIAPSTHDLERCFAVNTLDAIDAKHVSASLTALQASLADTFIAQGAVDALAPDVVGERFDSGFGRYAFRPPTIEECSDEAHLRQYLEASGIHEFEMHLLDLTERIAILDAHMRRVGSTHRREHEKQALEELRDEAIAARALPTPQAAVAAGNFELVSLHGRPMPKNIRTF